MISLRSPNDDAFMLGRELYGYNPNDHGIFAVFYQYDEYGFDGLRGTEIALKAHGLIPVAKGSYIRGTLDIENGLEKIIEFRV